MVTDVEVDFGFPVSRVIVESNAAQRWLVQEVPDMDLHMHMSSLRGSTADRVISMAGRFESLPRVVSLQIDSEADTIP